MSKPHHIFVGRTYTDNQTMGDAIVLNELEKVIFEFKTIELKWLENKRRLSCIPEDTYRVEKHVSPKFGNCFWIKDVKNRTAILIHKGNYAGSLNPKNGHSDTLGCILIGRRFADIDGDNIKDVVLSTPVMNELLEIMPDTFLITFRENVIIK